MVFIIFVAVVIVKLFVFFQMQSNAEENERKIKEAKYKEEQRNREEEERRKETEKARIRQEEEERRDKGTREYLQQLEEHANSGDSHAMLRLANFYGFEDTKYRSPAEAIVWHGRYLDSQKKNGYITFEEHRKESEAFWKRLDDANNKLFEKQQEAKAREKVHNPSFGEMWMNTPAAHDNFVASSFDDPNDCYCAQDFDACQTCVHKRKRAESGYQCRRYYGSVQKA